MKKNVVILILILLMGEVGFPQITFQKTYGGVRYDRATCVRQASDSGYIMVGFTESFGAGQRDIYLIKTNANGSTLWTKTYGGTSYDEGVTVRHTTDGGYIVGGFTRLAPLYNHSICLIKTDALGDTLWTKAFDGQLNFGAEIYDVFQTSDSGYFIVGFSYIDTNYIGNVFLIKTDSIGDTLWTRTFTGIEEELSRHACQTNDGGYVVAVYDNYYNKGYIIKMNAIGDTLWSKVYIGSTSVSIAEVHQTTDGGFILLGSTNLPTLIKTDALGNIQWKKTFAFTNITTPLSVRQTNDNGYIVEGSGSGWGGYGNFLMKTNSAGTVLWEKTIVGNDIGYGVYVEQTNDSGYIIAGLNTNFGAGAGDAYLLKTNSIGNSGCNDNAINVAITTPSINIGDKVIEVHSGGIVTNPPLIVGSGVIENTICLIDGIQSPNETPSSLITLFPNPTTSAFTISNSLFAITKIEIFNTLGEKVFSETLNEKQKTINEKLSQGIYIVRVCDSEKSLVRKLIVE